MALQDLTPQLRTRLSRLESAVGWFVLLAGLLLVTGFVYYVWHTAQRKGWFQEKVLFSTFVNTTTGIKAGDPVKLMGIPIGEILKVVPNEPNFQYGNVTIFFNVRRDANNYCGYIWSDSKVKVTAGDFMGNRLLEITKGQKGIPILRMEEPASDPHSKIIGRLDFKELKKITEKVENFLVPTSPPTSALEIEITNTVQKIIANPWEYVSQGNIESPEAMVEVVLQAMHRANPARFYQPYDKSKDVYLEPDESPALTERLERVVTQVEKALPNILTLTNQISRVMSNAVQLTDHLDELISEAHPAVTNAGLLTARLDESVQSLRPVITNLTVITTQLREPKGALGEWLIPTNLNRELEMALKNAQTTMAAANTAIGNTDTNLTTLVSNMNRSLDNLAIITSNLNHQVAANTNFLSDVSSLIRDTDIFVAGLRRHWLFRSAFKTNAPPKRPLDKSKLALPPRLQ